ncbi:MAG: response regulator [Actinomycetota bacterium]|nr:response regulator [Actinomycetota bacterium]
MIMPSLARARLLIVDDQQTNVTLLERLLRREGYNDVIGLTDPREVSAFMDGWRPDLVLLDLQMPHLDGYGVLEELRGSIPAGEYLPILVLTADISPETKRKALSAGAKDFLSKPFDPVEVLLRIRNLLESRFLHLQLKGQNEILDARVRERTSDLEDARAEILERLAVAAEFRDDDTGQHTKRVGESSALVAQAMGLPGEVVELFRRAAPLHDVGKIGIPDRILLKPGKLTKEEFEIVKTHTVIGARILSGSTVPLLLCAEEIARTHHEHWDGRGYDGLVGADIPVSGRVVAVADVFDALTHDRPYKHAWPIEQAVDEITHQRGAHFDPVVVDAFLEVLGSGALPTDDQPEEAAAPHR